MELQNTVAFGDELLFLSEFHQFKLDYGNEILSNETCEIMPVSQVVLNGRMQPAVISGELFFHNPARVFSSFLRYLTDDTKLKTAKSITDDIPSYIPSHVVQLAASEELKTLTVLSGGSPEKIFMYRFYKDDNGKIHNSWGEFDVSLSDAFVEPRVLFQYFDEDQLYLVIAEDGYNFSFNRIDLNEGFDDELPRMDRLIKAKNLSYDPITNLTRMDNPFAGKPSNDFEIVATDDLGKIELIVNSATTSPDYIYGLKDHTGKDVYLGFPYDCLVQLPHIFPRNYFNDGRSAANLKGRLMLQKIAFNYFKSGAFEVIVDTKNRAARTYRQKLDILLMETVDNNVFTVPLAGRNEETEITVKSSSVLPVHISSLAWQGNYNKNYKGRLG